MIIELEPMSEKPLYEQLILEIKRGIARGQLKPGEALPSVRSLASDIGINMHTVNKVYKYLAEAGILQKVRSGFCVSTSLPLKPTPKTSAQIRQVVRELVIEKNLYQMSHEEIVSLMGDIEEELSCKP
ncbi:MAG: GntR family transcriptional regulator [Turicibacter sp.]|nr:GntR family transcriptional regulator [Turicibacter sp.]